MGSVSTGERSGGCVNAALVSGLAALVAGVSASREMIGKPNVVPANGYVTVCYGIHVFELPYPIALRSLFPILIGPKRKLTEVVCERDSVRSYVYQALRIVFAWAAFWLLFSAYGLAVMAAVAAMFVLSLRFDYWSNFVELLGASVVFCAIPLGITWPTLVAVGLVLGLGRETLPLLALMPGGIPFAVGAIVSQGAVRLFRRELKHELNTRLAAAIEYGKCRLDDVWALLKSDPWETVPRLGLYGGILGLAFTVVPWATVVLGILTFCSSRIDEPRVVTQLMPWAAGMLVGRV